MYCPSPDTASACALAALVGPKDDAHSTLRAVPTHANESYPGVTTHLPERASHARVPLPADMGVALESGERTGTR